MSTIPEFDATQLLSAMEIEVDSIKRDVEYSWTFRNITLASNLSIPLDAIDNVGRSGPELAYAEWLQKNLDLGWLHFMSCLSPAFM